VGRVGSVNVRGVATDLQSSLAYVLDASNAASTCVLAGSGIDFAAVETHLASVCDLPEEPTGGEGPEASTSSTPTDRLGPETVSMVEIRGSCSISPALDVCSR
jgi:hypothetical protein